MSRQRQLEEVKRHVDAISSQRQLLSQSLNFLSRVSESYLPRFAAERGRKLTEAVPSSDAAKMSSSFGIGGHERTDG